MSELQSLTPHELLARIENRNRRFKIASVVFGAILITGLVALLVVGLNTLQGVDQQLASQKQLLTNQQKTLSAIGTSGTKTAAKIDDLQNHMDCIVELFRQPNRQNLTIRDLNSCQFDSNGNIITPSGGTNGTQKTNTIDGGRGSPAPAQPSTSSAGSPQAKPSTQQTGPIRTVTNTLFCPISLTDLTCKN